MNTTTTKTTGRAVAIELLLTILAVLAVSVTLSLSMSLPAAYAGETDESSGGGAGGENFTLNQPGADKPDEPAGRVVAGESVGATNGSLAGGTAGDTVGTSTAGQAAGTSGSSASTLDGQSGSSGANSLQAAASPDDPGCAVPQDIEVWLQPTDRTGAPVEGSNDVMVELDCVAGEGVEVGAEVSRVRVGNKDTANGDDVTIYNNAKYRREVLGIENAGTEHNLCIIFHETQSTTLNQGSYTDKGTSEPSEGYSEPLNGTNAHAGNYFMSMEFPSIAGFTGTGSSFGPYEENVSVSIPLFSVKSSGQSVKKLYFSKAGTYNIYAQFTYVEILGEIRQGTSSYYVYEWHAVHASNRVIFKINVADAPKTELQVKAKDPNGNDVDIASKDDFKVSINKKLRVAGMDGTYKEDYETWHNYTNERERWAGATAGTYKVKVSSNKGLYDPFEAEITIDPSEITGDVLEKVITIVPKGYIPQYNVAFVAEDGTTVLLAAAPYNENTVGELVVTPTNVPTKPEDNDYKYVHDGWTIVETGEWVSLPQDVTRDVTYKAYYRPISKKNVNMSPLRVIANGGLYALPTMPTGVVSYELQVSTPTADQSSALASTYAANIGNSKVLGMYNVDVIQHNDNGSDVSLHEGVGDMTLTFPVDGVADGTSLRVLQLHEGGESTEPELIEHTGLVASGGTVDVTLNDKLSTFIILQDAAVEEEPGTGGSGTDSSGSGGNDTAAEGVNGSSGDGSGESATGIEGAKGSESPEAGKADKAAESAKAAAAGEDATGTVEVKAMAANPTAVRASAANSTAVDASTANSGAVRTSTAADGSQLPETGDDLSALAALLLAAMASAVCMFALRRRESL